MPRKKTGSRVHSPKRISRKPREAGSRPFPWPCLQCFALTVVPTVMDFTAKVKHDGVVYDLHLPALEVPCCQTCGETVITSAVDEQINGALRSRLRLLMPAQVRKGIEKLGLKQQEVAKRLGVAPETISRWVNGALIQSRAMDNMLRLFFTLPKVRDALSKLAVERGKTMSGPEQERDEEISSTYEQVLHVLEEAGLADTDLETLFNKLEEHITSVRDEILKNRRQDDCWDQGP